tara:strand:+ start:1882 stop:2091 length:210 start_codon:yes stop_codon:yes gene_type:complete
MIDQTLDKLIKEIIKDIALRIHELKYEDRKSLLDEYREWIVSDPINQEILLLPYEAYTNRIEKSLEEEN